MIDIVTMGYVAIDFYDGSIMYDISRKVVTKGRSYRGLNFFAERDLQVLEVISRGEYMTFGMQGKDIRQHLENISLSAMSRIFKRLRLKANGIRIFDYPDFSQPLTEQVRQNAERIASENGIEIEFIRKREFGCKF